MTTKKFETKKTKIRVFQALIAVALILLLTFSAFVAGIQSAEAQSTTSTPENWVNLITQTSEGAYRPESGITSYPWTCSPGGNPSRTGYTDSPAVKTNHTLWRNDIAFHTWAFGLAANGTVYAISMDQNALFAFDAHTGEIIWQYNLPLPLTNETSTYSMLGAWNNDNFIHLAQNQIFAGYGDKMKTAAFGSESGALEWVSPEDSRISLICPPGTVFSNAFAVYITSHNTEPVVTTCYKLAYSEQIKMTKIWESANVAERISYYDGKVYGANDASKWVSCANAATGDLVWNYTLPSSAGEYDVFYQHPVIADGKAYFPLETNKLECLDANNGNLIREFVTEGDYVENLAVAYGKAYLIGGSESKLYCYDTTTGDQLWTFQAAGPIDYYTPVVADGLIYIPSAAATYEGFPYPGTYAGYMYCVDATTGDLVWKYLIPVAATCIWLADGNLYTTTPFGQIWCWGAGPTTTGISVTSSQLTTVQSLTISGSVTDMSPFSQQHPDIQSSQVSGVPIVLSYIKDGTWTDFATVNTASDGKYMYTWTPPNEGAYKVVARFEGNNAYYWSSAQAVVQVNSSSSAANSNAGIPTEYFVVTVAVFAVTVVVVALILRKRK
jgi:outer membrane protein assembly factor BamB